MSGTSATATTTMPQGKPASLPEMLQADVDRYLSEPGAAPGVAVAVVGLTTPIGSGLTLSGGSADLITGEPVTHDTRFCLGSVTKTFTAALLGQATVTQDVQLEDSVVPYLQRLGVDLGASVPLAEVRLVDLATHTAGMSDDAAGGGVPLFRDDSPVGTPLSSRWQTYGVPAEGLPAPWLYSNLGFVTLGFAVSGMFGRTSNDYVRLLGDHVCGPLKMSCTQPHPLIDRAVGYAWTSSPAQPRQAVDEEPPDLWSTSRDLATFLRAQLRDPTFPVPPELATALALTQADHGTFVVAGHPDTSMTMGLAWQRYADDGLVLRKNGALPGFTSDVQLEPDRGIGVAVLTNQSWQPNPRPPRRCLPAALATTLLARLRSASDL
ncbi:MAG TPA: serine hydrolase domain-containing protein [Microlunatus sp.]